MHVVLFPRHGGHSGLVDLVIKVCKYDLAL